jgi:transposase
MVSDAHNRAFAFFKGTCTRGIYGNMKTAVDSVFIGKALFAVSAVLAVLCGGRGHRRCRNDRNRTILSTHGNATLLLWLLWTALFPSPGL